MNSANEVGDGDNGAEAPLVSESPLPDPKRVSLLKCCEWLESKLEFKTLQDVGENSEIRSAFIEFISDPTIEAMFLYEDWSTGIVSVRFSAMEVPPEGQDSGEIEKLNLILHTAHRQHHRLCTFGRTVRNFMTDLLMKIIYHP